jgi:hypothetical protein
MKKILVLIIIIMMLICQGCSQTDSNRDMRAECQLIVDQINKEYGTNLKMATEESYEILESEGVEVIRPDFKDVDLIEFEEEMRKIAEQFVRFRESGWSPDVEKRDVGSTITGAVIHREKEPSTLMGTGLLRNPLPGVSTADFSAPTGTRVSAADGGVVTFADNRDSFGLTVEIDHGGNMSTLYAYCAELYVTVGDQVYQGQYIADVGSPGEGMEPRLHFEIHRNGESVDPLDYL